MNCIEVVILVFDKNVFPIQYICNLLIQFTTIIYCYGFGRMCASTTPNFTKDPTIIMRSNVTWHFDDSQIAFCSDGKYMNDSEL